MDGPDGHDHGAHGAFDNKAHSASPELWLSHHARGAVAVLAASAAAGVTAAVRALW